VNTDLLAQAVELSRRREPFAVATVVRCDPPTSAKPGAVALIRQDGTVTGWIGGSCAQPLTVEEALGAMRDGQPRLVALVGDQSPAGVSRPGVREHAMSCHSGGTLEIFIEPVLPAPRLAVVGSGPVVEALTALGRVAGFDVAAVEDAGALAGLALGPDAAVVVATHGHFDEDALDGALRSEAAYVSLVASPRRAAAVVEALQARGVPADRLARLKAPAGLDLGAVSPGEIGVSILAEIVKGRRSQPTPAAPPVEPAPPAEARDPICGMAVAVATARHTSEVGGRRFYFCCGGCKKRFDADPARYAAAASA
jgi:xanthine dehydrogenase accessory factor